MPAVVIASDGDMPEFEGKITFTVIVCVMIAACGGLMFGYDIGVSGNTLFFSPSVRICLHANNQWLFLLCGICRWGYSHG